MARLETKVVDNDSRSIGSTLESCLERSTDVDIAVAFARSSGLDELTALPRFQARGGRLRFLAGTDFQQTELEALDRLQVPGTEVRVNVAADAVQARRTFHPKVYICRAEDRVAALVGSANFTGGGLRRNVETAVLLSGPRSEPVLQDLAAVFEKHWSSPLSRPVSPALRQAYRALQDARGRACIEAHQQVARAELRLREAVADLLVPPGSLRSAQGSTWLLITSPTNFRLCMDAAIWGDDRRNRISKMRPGDRVLFYIKGLQALGACGLVSSEVFEDATPYWPDGAYGYRIRVQVLLRAELPIHFKLLLPELEGFSKDRSWGTALQTSQKELLPQDAAFLWESLREAAAPIQRLDSGLLVAESEPDDP